MQVWLKRLAWLVCGLFVLWVIAWLALPSLIRWQAPTRLSEALGRPVTMGAVGFKPWSLEFSVDDLVIGGQGAGAEPVLAIARVHVDLSISSIARRAPVITALEIDGPRLRIARTAEGHYDIDDLIARFTPKADAPPGEPARFALYNFQVRGAQLRFDDRPVARVHQVNDLRLALPFLSNLPSEIEVKVEPRLAFRLNGTPFDTGAQATPFAQDKTGALKLAVADLDLAPYLGYLPASLPVRLTRGSVSADLNLQFALPAHGAPSVTLHGTAGAKNVALTDAGGAPLLGWQGLQLALRDVQPLARKLALQSLRVDGLQLHAARDATGRINLLALAAPQAEVPPAAVAASGTGGGAVAVAVVPAWQVSLDTLDLADARVLWSDAMVMPAAALQLDHLSLAARQVQWPITQPIDVTLSGALHVQPAAGAAAPGALPALAEFSAAGPVTDREARLKLTLKSLSLAALSPYLAQTLVPRVEGQAGVQAQLDWSGAPDAPRFRLAIDNATLDALTVRESRDRQVEDGLALKQLVLGDVQIDLLARRVVLGKVKLVEPRGVVAREADGRLNLQRWLVGAAPANAPAATARPAARPAAEPAWRVQLKDLLVDGGELRFSDARVRPRGAPLRVALAQLRIAAQGLDWPGDARTAPAELQLSARIGAPVPRHDKAVPTGIVDYKGRVALQTPMAEGKLRIERFPVHLFEPYFAAQLPLALRRAEAGYKGELSVRQGRAGLEVRSSGDVLLGDVRVASLPEAGAPASSAAADELLSWQSLALKGVSFAMTPQARPRLEIAEAALSDFYSRLVITEDGRFNLQNVAKAEPPAVASAGDATAAAAAAPPPPPASAAVNAQAELPLDIKVGATRLTNGRIDFSDHFVRPNYSAALTELNGQLGAFSSGSREMATLELRGRAAGTALLEISGQLNPLARPLALDIRAKATDLELAPLSPYAGKYAGYAIERGKLSMDVAYKIDTDGRLEARNQVILNQLTFGEKIESKDAIKLPVLLAVALLKDRNGVIDVDLPITGSVNDPQFSVGGVIFKVILNLLTKAITSPFALLGGSGGDDLSQVEFAPGTAQPTPAGAGAIDKVAKALTERPALKMTVTGAADPVGEREAFQRAAIEARLIAEQRRESLRAGTSAPATSAPVVLGTDERARLLKQLYKDTDLPDKPRNLLGFAKDIPPAEMEALLKPRVPVSDDAMRELALQRGLAVRDALIAKGLPSERLFLAAPKLRSAEDETAGWTPRVQLALSVN